MKQRFFIQLVFSLTLCFNCLFSSCKEEKKTVKQTKVTFKKEGELSIYNTLKDSVKAKLDIEIADNDYEIQTGLMYRDYMKPNRGMLFVFEDETERYFYMKNTQIPLDIIFINANKSIVSFQKNAKPFDESSLPSNVPAKYVLEVNAGMSNTWKLSIGDFIDF